MTTKAAIALCVTDPGAENPRCERCDKMLETYHKGDPLDCGCAYAIKPWPYGLRQVLIETEDADVANLLRSLDARHSWKHGYFLSPARARIFEALWEAEVVPLGGRNYRFPDGVTRSIYEATRYLRDTTGRKVTA